MKTVLLMWHKKYVFSDWFPGLCLCLYLMICFDVAESSYASSSRRSAVHEFRSRDVTIPRIYSRNRNLNITVFEGAVLPGNILLEFTAFQKNFTLQLIQNKFLFSFNYTEKSSRETGDIFLDTRNESLCYYTGRIVGQPQSLAAFSLCSGIRGYVRAKDDGFHIEPWDWNLPKHYVFRDSDYTGPDLTCGSKGRNVHGRIWRSLDEESVRKKKSSIGWPNDNKTYVVELYVTNDYTQSALFQNNATKVFRRMKDIINIVGSFYRPLNIYISLAGAEVWDRGDRVEVSANVDKAASNFLEYRRYLINPKHRNDNAQLITGRTFGEGLVGKAPVMTMCTLQYSGGVSMDHSALVGVVASTVAHQLGHNFGLIHDTESCDCVESKCIMAAGSGGQKNPTKWSDCSRQQFADAFHQGFDYCLSNVPQFKFNSSICGNGFTEPGEDCDCGQPEDCINFCCDAATCKLLGNATCAVGECCDLSTCQLKSVTTECRPAASECDLGEYCDGISSRCPSDVFVTVGKQCINSGVASYCYQGQCNTRDSQCRLLWGVTGRASHDLCFQRYNVLGNASGHCGLTWSEGKSSRTKCEPGDSLCGLLHCHHLNEKLMFWKESLAYGLPESDVTVNQTRQECKGVNLDVGLDMPDPGMVPNGATCGDGKVCFNQQCRDVDGVFLLNCPDCNGHGVCNSIGQCHCDIGYAPPSCDRAGNGGSNHSGPIRINNSPGNTSSTATIWLCIFFLVILPLLVLLVICAFRHRRDIKHIWKQRTADRYRSVQHVQVCNTDSTEAVLPEVEKIPEKVLEKISEKPERDIRIEDIVIKPSPPLLPPPPLPASGPKRPISVVIRPNPSQNRASMAAKRSSSITTQDISSPQFVSSTNINLDSTLPLAKVRKGEFQDMKQAMLAGELQDESKNVAGTEEFQVRTLPNRNSKSRSKDKSNRVSCVEPSSSSIRSSVMATAEPAAKSKPSNEFTATLLGNSGMEENVYEEIGGQAVCPKISPPNPPNPEKTLSIADTRSQTAKREFLQADPVVTAAAPKRSDTSQSGSAKTKPKSSTSDKKVGKEVRKPRQSNNANQNVSRSSSTSGTSGSSSVPNSARHSVTKRTGPQMKTSNSKEGQ